MVGYFNHKQKENFEFWEHKIFVVYNYVIKTKVVLKTEIYYQPNTYYETHKH